MKTTFFTLAALLLIAAGSFYACREKEAEESKEPVVISFTEYSLTGTSCQWANLNYDNKVIVINSSVALESYLTNTTRSSYPVIDFSKHSLLLASGTANNAVFDISAKDLQQLVSKDYELSIEIILNPAIVNGQWVFALLTDKLNGDKKVELNASYKNCEDCGDGNDYPIDIPFEEYSLNGTGCSWKWDNLSFDNKVVTINSDNDLSNYVNCSSIGTCPPVDFSKHTLLLISGCTDIYGIFNISLESIQQLSVEKYVLNIDLLLTDILRTEQWLITVLVNKLDSDTNIEICQTTSPIAIEYSLWKWGTLPYEVIELIFFPSVQKVYIKTTPESLYYMHTIPGSIGIRAYYINENIMYWRFPEGQTTTEISWRINRLSENEMELIYTDFCFNCIGGYNFICQTSFNGI